MRVRLASMTLMERRMTLAPARPRGVGGDVVAASRPGGPERPNREPVVDFLRAVSLVAVVVIHLFMADVTSEGGVIVFGNIVDGRGWWPPVTWFVQIMPLFFIAGGYAAAASWTRTAATGGTPFVFVRARVQRLVPTALVMIGLLGVLLIGARIAGAPEDVLAAGGWWIARPLWFLGVYVVVNCLLAPYLHRWHRRMPHLAIAALVGAAVTVDVVVAVAGWELFGVLNFVFVWASIQQIGFWMFDGAHHRLSRSRAWTLLVASVAVVALLIGWFGYPADLILNANVPANVSLIAVGVAQFALLRLLYPRLSRLVRVGRVAAVTGWVNARSLSLYVWHVPVLALILAVALVHNAQLPEAAFTGEWWQMRLQLLGLSVALTCWLCNALAPVEAYRPGPPRFTRFTAGRIPQAALVTIAVTGVVAAVVLLLAFGIGVLPVTLGAGLLLATSLASSRRIAPSARARPHLIPGTGIPAVTTAPARSLTGA